MEYKSNLGIDLYCVWLLPNFTLITTDKINTFYEKSVWKCDCIQITELSFWSSDSKLVNYLKDYN